MKHWELRVVVFTRGTVRGAIRGIIRITPAMWFMNGL